MKDAFINYFFNFIIESFVYVSRVELLVHALHLNNTLFKNVYFYLFSFLIKYSACFS